MKLSALALDYDGTIALDGVFDPAVREAVGEARQRGIVVILVTGLRLPDLHQVAGDLSCFDVIVAENGAVLEFPMSGRHVQKGAIEIEVFEDGTIESLQIKPGEKVPVGTVLAMIRGAGPEQPLISAAAAPARAPVLEVPPRPAAAPLPQTGPQEESRRLRVSPMARKLAADLGVDVTRAEGTGSQGAITREDVERAATALKKPVLQQPPAPTARVGDMPPR